MDIAAATIRQLAPSDLPVAAEVIRAGFATVAREFGITARNCPHHTSFTTAEKLQARFDVGWMMYGLYGKSNGAPRSSCPTMGEIQPLCGFAALSDEGGGSYELHNLAVLPECRHRGYGKRLLDLCKQAVRDSGGSKITLGLIEEHTVLRDWYATNGFVHTGTRTFDHLPFTVGLMEWREGS